MNSYLINIREISTSIFDVSFILGIVPSIKSQPSVSSDLILINTGGLFNLDSVRKGVMIALSYSCWKNSFICIVGT